MRNESAHVYSFIKDGLDRIQKPALHVSQLLRQDLTSEIESGNSFDTLATTDSQQGHDEGEHARQDVFLNTAATATYQQLDRHRQQQQRH